MNATLATTPDCRRILAAAAEWRLLGLLLERPRPGWLEEIAALEREVDAADVKAAAAEALQQAREAIHLDVFGPGGLVSPREVAYRGREDPGRILADLNAFYGAFAYRPQAEDPIDHVAVEAGFAGYLLLKEAFARAQGDIEAAQIAVSGFGRFVHDHLQCFVEPMANRVESGAPVPYLVLATRALAARTGPAPEAYRGLAAEDDEGEFECGAGTDCGGCPPPSDTNTGLPRM